ncbi:hypothetical protein [Paenibacillus xerothermodurans]|uniref:DUF4878 domain-containing protein n=1 Tax=Paenibacillus xerothermodurans TaxID=1977292 RepID=A0A2W1NRC1_PAEXE|nr:hypothetical protein [Paenibacillus xerothermodurans]PZE21423.1 hypothetical protein CBW46_008720 [Paenibacillus xerothermodurans]
MSFTKKRVIYFVVILVVCLISFYYFFLHNNPNSKSNIPQRVIIEKFYQAFKTEDYGTIAPLFLDNNPQMVINVRIWYGDVQDVKIREIKTISESEKKVKVSVTSLRNNEKHNDTDTLILVKQNDSWLIKSYGSDLDYKLPG